MMMICASLETLHSSGLGVVRGHVFQIDILQSAEWRIELVVTPGSEQQVSTPTLLEVVQTSLCHC